MINEEAMKHWADEFNEIAEAKDARITELEKQLAERDAALARCVEALGTIELEASIFRVDPPMSEDELMAKFEAISELAGNTLESLHTSAQATAKVQQWQPIETAPKDKKVLAAYKNALGNWRRIIARYYSTGTLVAGDDDENADENGCAKEGWYEESESHEYILPSDCEPTHWRPLPEPPEAIREEQEGK